LFSGLSFFSDEKTNIQILFEDKALVEEMRIIKVDSADEFNGMVPPLTHAPDGWNSHREEDKPFHPF
jgi:hypothetical protein